MYVLKVSIFENVGWMKIYVSVSLKNVEPNFVVSSFNIR